MLAHTFIFRSKWEWRRCARGRLNQPKCPEVSAAWQERRKKRNRAKNKGHIAGWRKKQRDISSRSRDRREKERNVCLTDGGETRCHVAFRNYGHLGTSAVFIVLFMPLFFPPDAARYSFLYFRFSIHDQNPRRESQFTNDEARFGDLPWTFSFRRYLFLNDTHREENHLLKKELIPAMKIKNSFLSMDSASSPADIMHLKYLFS